MLTELWTGVGGKLADRLAVALFSPALWFWIVGVVAWLSGHGGVESWLAEIRAGGQRFAEAPVGVQIAIIAAVLVVVVVTGGLVDWLTAPTLRMLEGYWPRPVARGRRWLVQRVARRQAREVARWRSLQRPVAQLSGEDLAELVQLDRRLRRVPLLAQQLMPTALGNTLRASETRPARKYGLDPVVCWPQLWLVLPEAVRGDVSAARQRLDAAAAVVIWGILMTVWAAWNWWALMIAVALAVSGYAATVRAAASFGDLVEAAWDLHRTELYRALRWPLPTNPADEYIAGRSLTRYLRRGARGAAPTFI